MGSDDGESAKIRGSSCLADFKKVDKSTALTLQTWRLVQVLMRRELRGLGRKWCFLSGTGRVDHSRKDEYPRSDSGHFFVVFW